jgi:hypothetical protein
MLHSKEQTVLERCTPVWSAHTFQICCDFTNTYHIDLDMQIIMHIQQSVENKYTYIWCGDNIFVSFDFNKCNLKVLNLLQ